MQANVLGYSQRSHSRTNGCILIGLRTEPMPETGMRLTPGERQSGDGTSLPETPNNLTNVRTLPGAVNASFA